MYESGAPSESHWPMQAHNYQSVPQGRRGGISDLSCQNICKKMQGDWIRLQRHVQGFLQMFHHWQTAGCFGLEHISSCQLNVLCSVVGTLEDGGEQREGCCCGGGADERSVDADAAAGGNGREGCLHSSAVNSDGRREICVLRGMLEARTSGKMSEPGRSRNTCTTPKVADVRDKEKNSDTRQPRTKPVLHKKTGRVC